MHRANRRGCNVAVGRADFLRILANPLQHRAQIFEIEQQQPAFIRHAEHNVQHPFLGVVQLQQPRQHQRPHLRHRGANRVTGLPEQIPEHHRKAAVGVIGDAKISNAFGDHFIGLAHLTDAGQVALHIGHEDGDASVGQAFRQRLQRHRLAGAGGARNQPVTIRIAEHQCDFIGSAAADGNLGEVGHRIISGNGMPASIWRGAVRPRRGQLELLARNYAAVSAPL